MSVPVTHRQPTPRHLNTSDLARLRATLESLQAACRHQMDAAMAVLEELRSSGSVDDPQRQRPLMAALQALDGAERSALEVSDALTRIDAGTFGACARCESEIPLARLELYPFDRTCAACAR